MYHGVAEIYQENLDDFLAVAEELQLKGLTGGKEPKDEQVGDFQNKAAKNSNKNSEKNKLTLKEDFEAELYYDQESKDILSTTMMTTIGQPSQVTFNGGTAEDFKTVVWSMISQSGTMLTCTVCGKTKDKSLDRQATHHMTSHVESLHVEGATYECARCEKTFRSKHALHCHTNKAHKPSTY